MLVLPDGPARRVGPSGVLIGRQRDCDIVVADASVSRRHAHVRLTADGAEVVPLGNTPLDINGTPSFRPHTLADGDELRLPGLTLKVLLRPLARSEIATGFLLERAGGGTFGIASSPFAIGGDDADDLIVAGWPARLAVLYVAQRELFVEVSAEGVVHGDRELERDEPVALAEGDLLAFRGETFAVRFFGGVPPTTKVRKPALPVRVVIELLPRGGKIAFTSSDGEHVVHLADRRLDLMVALLRPPQGYAPGDFIPDDVVRAIVWPRNPAVTRPEINTLISRCRRDLVEAGLAGPRLLERAPTGGGTRIALAPGATIDVR